MLEHGFSVAGFLGADEQLGFGLAWAAGFLFAWGLPQPQYREFSVVFGLEQRKSRGTNRLGLATRHHPDLSASAHFTTGFLRCGPATGTPVLTSLVTINLTTVVVGYVFDSKAASAAAVAP